MNLMLWQCLLFYLSGHAVLPPQMSAFDPGGHWLCSCGNGFDAGFGPYQSTRLNRYDAVS